MAHQRRLCAEFLTGENICPSCGRPPAPQHENGLGAPRYVPPRTDVRALRERLGLSQVKFAQRYMLSQRTIEDWEQHRREPSDAARVLLFAISRNHEAVERALHG